MATPPQAQQGAVPRRKLLGRLARAGRDVRLVLLVAPTGYGKTTVLSQWGEDADRHFGWVQLDDSDNAPASMLGAIAAAAREDWPDEELSPLLALAAEGRPADAAAELAAALAGVEPRVLVLDDLHTVRRSTALQVVADLAAELPAGWVIAAAAQRPPRMRLARLRSQGRLLELGPADLAFAPAEAADLLRTLAVDLPDPAVRRIVTHAEGWPTGVYLAALIIAGSADPADAAGEITGSSRYIVDYFLDEVLARQSTPTVRFLLRTSVLDRACGPLCDAVLETTGSAAWLEEIQALNLFIVPDDDEGEWYRYHRLFAEMLRSELRRREPREETRIRRRASRWYEQHDQPEQAVRYAIAAGDQATVGRLITVHAQRFNSEGRMAMVREWLDTLDDEVLSADAPLAAMAAWVWALTGDGPRALWALRIAERSQHDGPLLDGSASLESAVRRARAGLAPLGVEVMCVDAAEAVRLEPPGSPWHTMAALLLGVAHLSLGARDEAVATLERAGRQGLGTASPGGSFALAQRSLLAADEGDWHTAASCAHEARAVVESANLQRALTSLPVYVAGATIGRHRGDLRAVKVDTSFALRLYRLPSPAAFPWLAAQMGIRLGRLLLESGDLPGAERKATDAGRSLPLLGPTVFDEQHRQLLVDLDRLRLPAHGDDTGLTAAELRLVPLLSTHLSLAEIAGQLVLSRNTIKTQVAAIYRKLDATSRTEAVRRAADLGLFDQR